MEFKMMSHPNKKAESFNKIMILDPKMQLNHMPYMTMIGITMSINLATLAYPTCMRVKWLWEGL